MIKIVDGKCIHIPMKRWAVIAAFFALVACAPAAKVKNGGFETGNWQDWQCDGEGWRMSNYGRDSRRGIYGAVNDVWTNASSEFRVLHQEIKAIPGRTYKASVELRTVCLEGSESFLEIQFLDKHGAVLKQFQTAHVKKDQEFTLMSINGMVAPEGTDRVSIRGVAVLLTLPVQNMDYHVFDNFDFRPDSGPDLPAQQAPKIK